MVEAIKMAARVATLVTLGVLIATLLATAANMLAGAPGIAAITPYLIVAYTFVMNWTGGVGAYLIASAGLLFIVEAAVLAYKMASIALRFALRVSEG